MTTRININVKSDGLIAAATDQTAINRQKQLDKEEAKRIEKEGLRQRRVRKLLGEKDKRFIYNQPSSYDELTAGGKELNNIGHYWISRKSEPVTNRGVWAGVIANLSNRVYANVDVFLGFKRTTKIYCGNGSSYVEIVHGIPDPDRQMIPEYSGFPPVTDPFSTTKACLVPDLFNGSPSQLEDFNYETDVKIFAFPAGEDRTVIFFLENYRTIVINANVRVTGNTRYDYPSEGDISALCAPPFSGPPYPVDPNNPFSRYAEIISPEVGVQYKSIRRCFICSNTSIREINIPSQMLSILNYMQPQVEFQTQIVQTLLFTGNFILTNYVAKIQIPVYVMNPVGLNYTDPLSKTYSAYSISPIVYTNITNLSSGPDSSPEARAYWQALIGPLAGGSALGLRALLEDQSDGLYSTTDSIDAIKSFNSNENFFYGKWKEGGEEPTFTIMEISELEAEIPIYDPGKYEYKMNKLFRMFDQRNLIDPESIDYLSFYRVWDWDSPNYCYAICKALGFSDSDLLS